MLAFDAPSTPSPLAIREFTRPRFDGSLERFDDWLTGLRTAGVRHSGPALMLALENLRGAEIAIERRLSLLSLLKTPLLKTCAGLPKPGTHQPGRSDARCQPTHSGVTLEQRLYRLMFVNLDQALRQIDRQGCRLSKRHYRHREWTVRNLFRFASRQLRYAALWETRLPENAWRDLHQLYLYLASDPVTPGAVAEPSLAGATWSDPELEYKQLLLFGLAARINPSTLRSEPFLNGLAGWASQTVLEDPLRMVGRIRLFLVTPEADAPPSQRTQPLDASFRGWVLQAPYSFLHRLEENEYTIAPPRFVSACLA